jgi:hypothetical protein
LRVLAGGSRFFLELSDKGLSFPSPASKLLGRFLPV